MSELTAKDLEKGLPENDKRLEVCLMGLAYDIIQKNKGIEKDQIALLVSAKVQHYDPYDAFGLCRYTKDKESKEFRVKKADWSKALSQYSQEKISQWAAEASRDGKSLQDYLLNNISNKLVLGYHFSGVKIVDSGLARMLSDDCHTAVCKNFDEKEKQVSGNNKMVSLSEVRKALRTR